jgi:rRNA maturation RNase YbeY
MLVAERSRRLPRRSPSLVHSAPARPRAAFARLAVDVSADGVRSPLGADRVRELVRKALKRSKVRDAMISVTFLPNRRMAKLNREHLDRSGPTDVIAFGFGPTGPHGAVVGDIYIAPDVARRNAEEFGVGVREELARLVVHGTLHVLGRDHPEGRGRVTSTMWAEQERLIRDAR